MFSWGTYVGASGASIGVADLCAPAKGPTLVCLRLLEQGPEVSVLLRATQVECLPSWAPPISMLTLSSPRSWVAIGVKAHCISECDLSRV